MLIQFSNLEIIMENFLKKSTEKKHQSTCMHEIYRYRIKDK